MPREIRIRQQKKLLRLISARADMEYALKAYAKYKMSADGDERYSHFLTFVVSYCRPFTENSGLGNLDVEFPTYPQELNLDQASLRHQRMLDLRNKFLSHSSLEGSKVVLLAPDAIDPGTGMTVGGYKWNIAKREFLDECFTDWLVEIARTLTAKLDAMVEAFVAEVGLRHLDPAEVRYLDTPVDSFQWTTPS